MFKLADILLAKYEASQIGTRINTIQKEIGSRKKVSQFRAMASIQALISCLYSGKKMPAS